MSVSIDFKYIFSFCSRPGETLHDVHTVECNNKITKCWSDDVPVSYLSDGSRKFSSIDISATEQVDLSCQNHLVVGNITNVIYGLNIGHSFFGGITLMGAMENCWKEQGKLTRNTAVCSTKLCALDLKSDFDEEEGWCKYIDAEQTQAVLSQCPLSKEKVCKVTVPRKAISTRCTEKAKAGGDPKYCSKKLNLCYSTRVKILYDCVVKPPYKMETWLIAVIALWCVGVVAGIIVYCIIRCRKLRKKQLNKSDPELLNDALRSTLAIVGAVMLPEDCVIESQSGESLMDLEPGEGYYALRFLYTPPI